MGFMFGNVDNSGDLDADYLDEVSLFVSLKCNLLFLVLTKVKGFNNMHMLIHKLMHMQVIVGFLLKLTLSEGSSIYLRQGMIKKHMRLRPVK